jgi:uncharacterized protein
MTYLIDSNVWFALTNPRHEHHQIAAAWFNGIGDEQGILCRIAEMGLLRLLTNRRTMDVDTLKAKEASALVHSLRKDVRVRFRTEPPDLEYNWHHLMEEHPAGHNTWTDAYLAAFALGHGATLVTLDRAFRKWPQPDVLMLA